MDAPCKIQGNIHVLLCLIHKINVSRILGTYHTAMLLLDGFNYTVPVTVRIVVPGVMFH